MTLSVVIPAHNAEAFLSATLDSIGRQTVSATEVIVVDDASTDRTADVALRHRFPDGTSPRLIRHGSRLGVAAARNRGVFTATGEWIGLCDADDLWHPERIARVMEVARSQSDALAVATGVTSFALEADRLVLEASPRGGMVDHWVATDSAERLTGLIRLTDSSPQDVTLEDLCQDIVFATTTVCYRRETWAVAGGCATWNHLADDYILNVAVATLGRVVEIPDPLVFYRVRPRSLSHDSSGLAVPYLIANLAAKYAGPRRDTRAAGDLYRHLLRDLSTGADSLTTSELVGLALLGRTGVRSVASAFKHRRTGRSHSREASHDGL